MFQRKCWSECAIFNSRPQKFINWNQISMLPIQWLLDRLVPNDTRIGSSFHHHFELPWSFCLRWWCMIQGGCQHMDTSNSLCLHVHSHEARTSRSCSKHQFKSQVPHAWYATWQQFCKTSVGIDQTPSTVPLQQPYSPPFGSCTFVQHHQSIGPISASSSGSAFS